MSVQSDRFRGQMPDLLEAVCIMLGGEGKGQLLKPQTQMRQSSQKIDRSGRDQGTSTVKHAFSKEHLRDSTATTH